MIANAVIGFGGWLISLVAGALAGIGNWAVPSQFGTSFNLVLGYLGKFEGVFPIKESMACVTFLLVFFSFWYTAHLLFKAFSLLPWFGKKVHPKISK